MRAGLALAVFPVAVGFAVVLFLVWVSYDLTIPMSRDFDIKVVMNPDSTQFAYALGYHRYPGWLDPIPWGAARVQVWTYDLSRRTGPRLVGGWSHGWKDDARLLQWTAKGLYLAYRSYSTTPGERPRTECELVDPRTGHRHFIGEPPWDELRNERPAGVDPNHIDEYRHTRHVEERFGEFGLWDPVTLKLVPLFALPLDPDGQDPEGRELMRSRRLVLREDGFQRIERADATDAGDGVLLHIRTYTRRTAPFTRRYRLHLDTISDERLGPSETTDKFVAVWDTLVTPNPRGDTLVVHVPYSRIWKALRPDRALLKEMWGSTYPTELVTTLLPDSLPGDEGVPPGLWNGAVDYGSNLAGVEIPLP